MATGKFDGWGFAPGYVTGARSFLVREDGVLTGRVFTRAWEQGENQADCRRPIGYHIPGVGVSEKIVRVVSPTWLDHSTDSEDPIIRGGDLMGWKWEVDGVVGVVDEKPVPVHKAFDDDDHSMAECKCGFYAYYTGSLDFASNSTVSGIVQGYGKVAWGDRGFRAEKVKILAIYIPPEAPHEGYIERRFHDQNMSLHEAFDDLRPHSKWMTERFGKIRDQYPGVPIYYDFEQMLADFPVDEPREEAA